MGTFTLAISRPMYRTMYVYVLIRHGYTKIYSDCCAQLVKQVVYPGWQLSACTTGVDHVVLHTEGIT